MSTGKELSRPANQILSALPESEYKRLLPHLKPVTFSLGETIFQPGDPIRYVYFVGDALISLLITLEGGESVEVGLMGSEGMLGVHLALGGKVSPNLVIAQIPGSCLKMKADTFKTEFSRNQTLRDLLMNYTSGLLFMVSQTVACNRVHRLEQRLSRWILMVRDRVHSETFPMTHEFMSRMLGTPRSEVSKAAAALKRGGLIRYAYGSITILDQAALESTACECYGVVKNMYETAHINRNGRNGRPKADKPRHAALTNALLSI